MSINRRLRAFENRLDSTVLRTRLLIEESHRQRIKCTKRLHVKITEEGGKYYIVEGRVAGEFMSMGETRMSDLLKRVYVLVTRGDKLEVLEWVKDETPIDVFKIVVGEGRGSAVDDASNSSIATSRGENLKESIGVSNAAANVECNRLGQADGAECGLKTGSVCEIFGLGTKAQRDGVELERGESIDSNNLPDARRAKSVEGLKILDSINTAVINVDSETVEDGKTRDSSVTDIKLVFEFEELRNVYRIDDRLAIILGMRYNTKTNVLIELWRYVRLNKLIHGNVVRCNSAMEEIFGREEIDLRSIDIDRYLYPIDPIVVDLRNDVFDIVLDVDDLVDYPILYTNTQIGALQRRIDQLKEFLKVSEDRIKILEEFSKDPEGYISKNAIIDNRNFFYDPLVQDLIIRLMNNQDGRSR